MYCLALASSCKGGQEAEVPTNLTDPCPHQTRGFPWAPPPGPAFLLPSLRFSLRFSLAVEGRMINLASKCHDVLKQSKHVHSLLCCRWMNLNMFKFHLKPQPLCFLVCLNDLPHFLPTFCLNTREPLAIVCIWLSRRISVFVGSHKQFVAGFQLIEMMTFPSQP